MILIDGLFNSGLFEGGLFNGGLFKQLSAWFTTSLFSNGEQGAWYDPSDLSTLFQDASGTTPVTASGQLVGYVIDKSGNGNHASQATTSKKPVYRDVGGYRYLEFDGVDDCLITPAINFSSTDKQSIFIGLRQGTTAATRQAIVELGTDYNGGDGRFALFVPSGTSSAEIDFRVRGLYAVVCNVIGGHTARDKLAISCLADLSADSIIVRRNGNIIGSNNSDLGNANFASDQKLYIGMRAGSSIPFSGYIYSLIVSGKNSSAYEIGASESYINSKTGAY